MLIKDRDNRLLKYQKDLVKKLEGYADRAPVKLSISLVDSVCEIEAYELNKAYKFTLDYEKEVRSVVKMVRDWFFDNAYPKLTKLIIKEAPLTLKEIEELIDTGVSADQAVLVKRHIENEVNYVIEKLILKKNQIVVRDITNKSLDLYDIAMPVVAFLNKLKKMESATDRYKMFNDYKKLVKENLKDMLGEPISEYR